MNELNELAKNLVGDGKTPNMFFVSLDGEMEAIFVNFPYEALDFADKLSTIGKKVVVEDRLTGVIKIIPEDFEED